MTRLYGRLNDSAVDNAVDDAAEVQRHDDEPEQFVWRCRLYRVRSVLGHWVESGGWWRTGAATDGALDDREREFWRVEAAVGRLGDTGVFDLCFDWSPGRWSVVRVQD